MRPLVKRIDMALHVQEICARHDIKVRYQPLGDLMPRYVCNRREKTITIRPTKNTGHYVSALHEIGHLLGKYQHGSSIRLTQELYAWIWAYENGLLWTETAERIMRRSMDTYGWTDREKDKWDSIKVDNSEQDVTIVAI